MSEPLPDEVKGWIDQVRYEEEPEFEIEKGYVYSSCSSTQNGNPLYWDEAIATEITGGLMTPPSMMSVWFRPHHWAPGRTKQRLPLQIHFDLKEKLDLPEAVMTDNEVIFFEPIRPGDRLRAHQVLRSVSDLKQTKLGLGRFWVIDVEYVNQHGTMVGKEIYTGFGYRRGNR